MRRQPAPAYLGAVSQLPQLAPLPGGPGGSQGMQMVSAPGFFPEDVGKVYPEGEKDSTTARVIGTTLFLTAVYVLVSTYYRS